MFLFAVCFGLVFLILKGVFCGYYHALPDIVFVGKNYDDSCVWVFSKTADDLVKLSLLGLPGNLDRLGDAHTS